MPGLEKKAKLRLEKQVSELKKALETFQKSFYPAIALIENGMSTIGQALPLNVKQGLLAISQLGSNTKYAISKTSDKLNQELLALSQQSKDVFDQLNIAQNQQIGLWQSVNKQNTRHISEQWEQDLASIGKFMNRTTTVLQDIVPSVQPDKQHFEQAQNRIREEIEKTKRDGIQTIKDSKLVQAYFILTEQTPVAVQNIVEHATDTIELTSTLTSNYERKVQKKISQSQSETAKTLTQTKEGLLNSLTQLSETAENQTNKWQSAGRKIAQDSTQPINSALGFLDRTRIWLNSFNSIVLDPNPTQIANVTIEEIGTNYMTVSWDTNHYATGKVNFGEDLTYGEEVFLSKLEKHHIAKLTGLKPGVRYYFEIMSQGKTYVYDAYYSFETKKP